jgi:hypothetical protein
MAFLRKTGAAVRRVGTAYVWSITGDWREVRENAERVSNRLQGMWRRKYREESFTEAVERLQLTDECLKQRHRQLANLSILYALIVVVALFFLSATPLSDHPFNHALMSVSAIIVASTKFMAARFRVAQIRAGQLFGFKEWIFGKGRR